jgi:hypothetical protein
MSHVTEVIVILGEATLKTENNPASETQCVKF